MKDIRNLTNHFNDPDGGISPWIFIPEANVQEMSAAESPGLLTIWPAGLEQDIKGMPQDPIRIGDYDMPWQFQLCLAQNYNAALLGAGDVKQANYAIGLNLAVTFSDPATWPEKRDQQPPDTRSFQLLAVHLGSTGEFAEGLPQFADPGGTNETYLVWGRGDLDEQLNGDWKVPHIYLQSMPYHGAASPQFYFYVDVISPTRIRIGFEYDNKHAILQKEIDCSQYGEITGIWEIGPILSCDRWIPDTLCPQLPIKRNIENPPVPIPPSPTFEFYVDYCVFRYRSPAAPWDHDSDDFDIPGYLGKIAAFQIPFSAETWSNPGSLTITLLGPSQGCWFWGDNSAMVIDLGLIEAEDHPMKRFYTEPGLYGIHKPPWEMEICFSVPDDSVPWNLHFHHRIHDETGNLRGYWQPGVMNSPAAGGHKYINYYYQGPGLAAWTDASGNFDKYLRRHGSSAQTVEAFKSAVQESFQFDVPEYILAAKPLSMLYQMVDHTHVKIGFKGGEDDRWHLSKPFDIGGILNSRIGLLSENNWGIVKGRAWGLEPGSPMYQQFLIHHIHYRYGLSV